MADRLTQEHRSWLMSRVRGKDTKPEWILRSGLHRLGFRYRLRNRKLPGRPDLVFPKYRSVVFVHGCFWHRHRGCSKSSMPKSNTEFWRQKFEQTVERDKRNCRKLRAMGWRVIVVWQCELYRDTVQAIERVAGALSSEVEGRAKDRGYSQVLDRQALLEVAEEKVQYRLRRECDDR